jgi:hypothetical protein
VVVVQRNDRVRAEEDMRFPWCLVNNMPISNTHTSGATIIIPILSLQGSKFMELPYIVKGMDVSFSG